jgi:hypothetical protein
MVRDRLGVIDHNQTDPLTYWDNSGCYTSSDYEVDSWNDSGCSM